MRVCLTGSWKPLFLSLVPLFLLQQRFNVKDLDGVRRQRAGKQSWVNPTLQPPPQLLRTPPTAPPMLDLARQQE